MYKIETGKIHILLTDLRELPCSVSGKPASFAARKLTAAALSRFLGREPSPEELLGESRSENGKPFFPAYPDFHYNISHSGDYAALAFAGQPVGIDIQKIQGRVLVPAAGGSERRVNINYREPLLRGNGEKDEEQYPADRSRIFWDDSCEEADRVQTGCHGGRYE